MSNVDWFADEGAGDNDLVAVGVHKAEFTNVTLDMTKDAPKFSLEFTMGKRKAWMNLSLKESGKKFLNWQVRELGAYESFKTYAGSMKLEEALLKALSEKIGAAVDIDVTHREYQGKTYLNVKIDHVYTTGSGNNTVGGETAQTGDIPF